MVNIQKSSRLALLVLLGIFFGIVSPRQSVFAAGVHTDSYVEGYSDVGSVPQGGVINFKVHSPNSSYLFEVKHYFGSGSETFITTQNVPRISQAAWADDASFTGLNWKTTNSVIVDPKWPSGFYAARVTDTTGAYFEIPFIVRESSPGTNGSRILIIAPTNTWQAYNCWGGHSLYTNRNAAPVYQCGAGAAAPLCDNSNCDVTVSTQRPYSKSVALEGMLGGHLESGERNLLQWFSKNGYSFAMATDEDVHADSALLSKYSVVVIPTHSEYWSEQMYNNLQTYIAGGGNVFYLGGNSLYWKVILNGNLIESRKDGTPHTFVGASGVIGEPGGLWTGAKLNRPAAKILGVQFTSSDCAIAPADTSFPMLVKVNDPFAYRGLGVSLSSQFGTTNERSVCGKNLSAWEMDSFMPGISPTNTVVLASGGAGGESGTRTDMTYYRTSGSGIVFSVGSIEAGRVLSVDPILSGVMRNMLSNVGVVAQTYRPFVGDFNGDGLADILWDNEDSTKHSIGQRILWTRKSNGTYSATTNVNGVDSYYNGFIPYLGDFNGDGKTDILWDWSDANGNSAGSRILWTSNGDTTFSVAFNVNSADTYYIGWRPLIGDFNGDGKSDILWDTENSFGASSGYRILWLSSGSQAFVTSFNVNKGDLQLVGYKPFVGDFNGDGKADVLWDHLNSKGISDGKRVLWTGDQSGGSTFAKTSNVNASDTYYLSWRPYLGDFNGDGKTDILWDWSDALGQSLGSRILWNGTASPGVFGVTSNAASADGTLIGSVPTIADLNADQKSDVLWSSSGGTYPNIKKVWYGPSPFSMFAW